MKVTASKRDLVDALSVVLSATDSRGTHPLLSCALLTAHPTGTMTLEGTNLNLTLERDVAAEVVAEGRVALGCRQLYERVKAMPDGLVTLETKAESVILRAGTSARQFRVPLADASDYPRRADLGDVALRRVPASALRDVLREVRHAMSTNEARPQLHGALIEWEGERLRAVATDGHRLALSERAIEGTTANVSALVPYRAVHELAKLCEGLPSEATCELAFGARNLEASVGKARMVTSLVEAQFPPFRQVIPKGHPCTAVVSREALLDATRAVAVSADAKALGIHLRFAGSTLTLLGASADGGDGTDELDCAYVGGQMTIAVNASYLRDALGAIESDLVMLHLRDEMAPLLVTITESDAHQSVIMPMRT